MIRFFLFSCIPLAAFCADITPEQARSAAARALDLVQQSATVFSGKAQCFNCHHYGLATLAARMGQERGMNSAAASKIAAQCFTVPVSIEPYSIDKAVQALYQIDPSQNDGMSLLTANAAGIQPSLSTNVYAMRIAKWQQPDGHWITNDTRPPHGYSHVTATAVAVRAMRLYMPRQLSLERDQRIAKAAAWLAKVKPRSTEEATFRLLGLSWASSPSGDAKQALFARQRPDGGWSQTPETASDAYSTGQAIYALSQAASMKLSDPRIERAIAWLLRNQKPDGSWMQETRQRSPASVSPPFFDAGFPHGKNQFISAAATSWAILGLLSVVPKTVAKPEPLVARDAVAVKGEQPWMETALFGSAAELRNLLDGGLDPNAHSDAGTSLLMMAAHDPAKVSLLLARGANAAARAKSGFTALFIASNYRGNIESVKQLLAEGAPAKAGDGVMFGASPLYYAAAVGDADMTRALLEAGADPNRKMNLLGIFPTSPIVGSITSGAAITALLAKHGAALDEKDPDGLNLISTAAISHCADAVRVLAKAGVKVNSTDKFGWTPLMYASAVDFGDADVVTALLELGADTKKSAPDGKTAASLAKLYNSNAAAALKH